MRVIADLHIHSKYSRATSKDLNIENLSKWAKIKGLTLLGTGDFTHPKWLKELKKSLEEDGSGILKSKDGFNFILQAEVSNIYTQGGKGRRIHNVLLAPSFEVVDQINDFLSKKGNLEADGRPIFGKMNCIELVESLKEISKDIHIIPAHAWTPWFSLFGSMSGFDSIEECFGGQSKHIFAIETGLSSDPAMNWRLSSLDRIALVSNSDSHSFWPWRIGREANVFELKELTYRSLMGAIKNKDRKKFLYTIEVEPAYGKYHLDGHRNCDVCMLPRESEKLNNFCPKCRMPLTIGVLHRVEELADRPEGFIPKNCIPFKKLIPLSEIIAHVLGTSQPASKKVWSYYNVLVDAFGNELEVLLNAPFDSMKKKAGRKIAEAIIKNREEKIKIEPGYDGKYGFPVFENNNSSPQKKLADF